MVAGIYRPRSHAEVEDFWKSDVRAGPIPEHAENFATSESDPKVYRVGMGLAKEDGQYANTTGESRYIDSDSISSPH